MVASPFRPGHLATHPGSWKTAQNIQLRAPKYTRPGELVQYEIKQSLEETNRKREIIENILKLNPVDSRDNRNSKS